MHWSIIVMIIFVILYLFIGFISLFVKPLRDVARVLFFGFKCVIEVCYVGFLWWWIAIIRLIRKEPLPKVWLFSGKMI